MRYSSKLMNPVSNPSATINNPTITPSIPATTDMSSPITPITPPTPKTFNPGIKPTGAPVTFNPSAQATMTGAFGVPMEGTYDRAISPTQMNKPTY